MYNSFKMLNTFKSKHGIVATLLFVALAGWWAVLNLKGLDNIGDSAVELFSASYGLMALYGACVGIATSRLWGGFRSLIGRSLLMFSFGLLAQEFGQITYSAYTYLFKVEIPYPSIGDIGYFGSILFYIYAVLLLIKATSVKVSISSLRSKLWMVLTPMVLLAFSYFEFLKEYEVDWAQPLVVALDFGYPLGQAIYIALAILTFILSKKYLGGLIKPAILTLLTALCIQYIADFSFLYQVSRETWRTAGINDFTYLVSYFVMTVALLRFRTVINSLRVEQRSVSQAEEANDG